MLRLATLTFSGEVLGPLAEIGTGAVVAGKMLEQKDANYGFDAQKGEYGDMIKAGIIDPVKIVRTALQGAASVAGLLVTTEAMVAEIPGDDAGGVQAGSGIPHFKIPIQTF